MDSLAKANQVATETFSYVKTVKCFANEDGETEKYRAQLDKTYALNKKEAAAYASSMWANSVSRLHACIIIIICIIPLYYYTILFISGESGKTLIATTKEKAEQKYRKRL